MAPQLSGQRLDKRQRIRIKTLAEYGLAKSQISSSEQVPISTVYHVLKSPDTPQKPRGRQPIIGTPIRRQLSEIIDNSREAALLTWPELYSANQELLCGASYPTFQRALRKAGYSRNLLQPKPFQNPEHAQKRLDWCLAHRDWTIDQWRCVIATDESAASLDWGPTYITRKRNEPLRLAHFRPKFRGFSLVLFGGAIAWGTRGKLLFWDKKWGSIDAPRYSWYFAPAYADLRQDLQKLFPNGLVYIVEDNAPIHTARLTRSRHRELGDLILIWPANSPDLNPIENMWAIIKKKVQKRRPRNESELKKFLTEEWDSMSQSTIDNLIDSFPARIEACIAAAGGPTSY